MDIKNIRELYIASDIFDSFDKSSLQDLDYIKWRDYISASDPKMLQLAG